MTVRIFLSSALRRLSAHGGAIQMHAQLLHQLALTGDKRAGSRFGRIVLFNVLSFNEPSCLSDWDLFDESGFRLFLH